jgi:hypothetical protein
MSRSRLSPNTQMMKPAKPVAAAKPDCDGSFHEL